MPQLTNFTKSKKPGKAKPVRVRATIGGRWICLTDLSGKMAFLMGVEPVMLCKDIINQVVAGEYEPLLTPEEHKNLFSILNSLQERLDKTNQ